MSQPPRRIVALIFDGSDVLDIAGPMAVFSSANQHARDPSRGEPPYELQICSLDGGLIVTEQGITIDTEKAPRDLPQADTILLVGGSPPNFMDKRLVEWVRRNHHRARRVASVCLGAFLLAEAGLLDGREATTHWYFCDRMQRDYPDVIVQNDAIYIPGGHVWTSAGVTAGIDMALAMLEQDLGKETALLVARFQVMFLKRPGGQSQFSTRLRSQAAEGPFAELLGWIADNPCADLSTEALAERAHMSVRNFHRAFKQAARQTPAQWVESARVEEAKRLLEHTGLQVAQVALMSGFGKYERMRRAFMRRLNVSPGDYRARFAPHRRAGLTSGSAVP